MTKQEFIKLAANLAQGFWENEEEVRADMISDGEEASMAMDQRSEAGLMMDMMDMLEAIYADQLKDEIKAHQAAQARVANPYR